MGFITKTLDCLCCRQRPKYPDPYDFQFFGFDNHEANKNNFQSNYVKTSKYTWYNFIPKSLFFQFRRLANVYFVFIAILHSIPLITPLIPGPAWIGISSVLTVSLIRQGYEDYQRYKSDQQMNHGMKTQVRRDGRFTEIQWCEVLVGDICLVRQNQLFPADMILLTSSNQGTAFIQTASLDGEKNLKPRVSHPSTIKYSNLQLLNQLRGLWKGKLPDKELHKFSSNMIIGSQTIVYEGDKQFLYRGTRLRNTKWIYGLVIYTGKNTKILINTQSHFQKKMSQIQHKVNRILIFILLLQITLCLITSISFGIYMRRNSHFLTNIHNNNLTLHGDSILIFFTYYILINSMIPISLIVSMEIVKLIQAKFIKKDNLMYSQYRDKFPSVKSASLNQQLGQIQYIFSDKTGTLTMNKMEFKIAIIGSEIYGDLNAISHQPNQSFDEKQQKGFKDQKLYRLIHQRIGNFNLNNPLVIKGGHQMIIQTQAQLCEQFFLALSIAHEVIAEKKGQDKRQYHGPSPDQITLVDAAREMQFEFIKSNKHSIQVNIKGNLRTFEILQVFPFNSDRKRMSVIIRLNGILRMYIKGADNIIKQRLASDNILNLDNQLDHFSRFGLRTLLIGMKTIPEEEYQNFKRAVEKLPHQNRQPLYEQLVSQLEKKLYIIGATAVLDRLQDFVPQTIRDLIRAKIKIWMLTGDKMETAENIAKSCNLFQNSFEILRLGANKTQTALEVLNKQVIYSEYLIEKLRPKGLLIEGEQLNAILETEQGEIQFVNLAKNCEAVVCCRLIPSQKARLVQIIKNRLDKITLAIGDGANDVPMIKAAHIGIGLFGEQGMSAVQASDYAIPEFRMLWRLLLVHGRWNYIRISQMILYFFYKNMLFTIPQFTLSFFCGFSGQSMYDDWFIAFYNLVFTSIPLVIRAILEQDVNYITPKKYVAQESSMESVKKVHYQKVIESQLKYLPKGYGINPYLYKLFPKIYFIGQQNCIFNYGNYFAWAIQAICSGILITVFSVYILGKTSINQNGISNSLWLVGLTTYSSVICIVTFKICTHTKFISKIFLLGVLVFSIILYIAFMWANNYYLTNNIMGTTVVAWTTPNAFLTVLFSICMVLFLDGIAIHIDFHRGGYTSKMRKIIDDNMAESKTQYDNMSLKMTEFNQEEESPKYTEGRMQN